MEDCKIAIQIEGLKKEYQLGVISGGTLQHDIQSWWARFRKKEDPNQRIGTKSHSKNEKFIALDGVDLTVYKGERLGIIGQNGAGKSTLLKLISRITAPTSGAIYLNGRVASMLEVGTGFHIQLTGRENIYMNGAILGMTKKEIDRKIEDIIDFSEVREFIDTPVKRYSSGMFVKLAFSVAAHLDNEIMIMDEVLAVGDMAFQQKCINKMRDVSNEQARTILYVSHNMNTIRQLCDRVIVLDHGKVVFNGDVEDGISVYMNTVSEKGETKVDLTDKPRHHLANFAMQMTSVELVGKGDCIFERGERLKLKLNWTAKEDRKGVKLIIAIRTPNDNSTVGTSVSKALCDCAVGKDYSVTVALDTAFLAKGKYFFNLIMSQDDGEGNVVILDFIARAFSVDIVEHDKKDDTINRWNAAAFGYIHYPELEIVE